jgi:hypothetical protein
MRKTEPLARAGEPVWGGMTLTCRVTGLGRRDLAEKINDGTVRAVMSPGGGKWLVNIPSALAYVASLPPAASGSRRRLQRDKTGAHEERLRPEPPRDPPPPQDRPVVARGRRRRARTEIAPGVPP